MSSLHITYVLSILSAGHSVFVTANSCSSLPPVETLPIHHTMYGSSWYLSILGVVTTFTLFSVLLLTGNYCDIFPISRVHVRYKVSTFAFIIASLDSASLVAALMLLLTNLVLLTATVKRELRVT